MSDVTVTVRGEHEARIAPERATIRVSVRTDGPDRTAVVERALELADPLRSGLVERKAASTLIEWTSKNLSVRAERPWSNDGRRLAPVYYASVDFTATFSSASELSLWVTDVSAWEGVEIGWVNWHLTPETNARVEREVAAEAVRVAVNRAEAYATALGRSAVVPVEIADVGLISAGAPAPPTPSMKSRAMSFDMVQESGSMSYEPDEIVIAATVEARFIAS
ncbi:SIMPL domain-containing protein [Microbacterium sp. ZW T5_45]|uniref:SIMPL domain-containing protein n=1 Tax=Microbacterium sp. ZW T5_45 TaxID=3378080 RepID=UPI0038536FEF